MALSPIRPPLQRPGAVPPSAPAAPTGQAGGHIPNDAPPAPGDTHQAPGLPPGGSAITPGWGRAAASHLGGGPLLRPRPARPARKTSTAKSAGPRRRRAAPTDEDGDDLEAELEDAEQNAHRRVAASDGQASGDDRQQDQNESDSGARGRRQAAQMERLQRGATRLPPAHAEALASRLSRATQQASPDTPATTLIRRELLQALRAQPGPGPLDAGGLARVKALLLAHAPAAGTAVQRLNQLMPLILLSLQRDRTEPQIAAAIARLQLLLHPGGRPS